MLDVLQQFGRTICGAWEKDGGRRCPRYLALPRSVAPCRVHDRGPVSSDASHVLLDFRKKDAWNVLRLIDRENRQKKSKGGTAGQCACGPNPTMCAQYQILHPRFQLITYLRAALLLQQCPCVSEIMLVSFSFCVAMTDLKYGLPVCVYTTCNTYKSSSTFSEFAFS